MPNDAMSTLGYASSLSAVRSTTDSKLFIRNARQVVTLQGPPRIRVGAELHHPVVLRDASILIEGGCITHIGSARRLENLRATASAQFVDGRHLVIIPGFVDAVGDIATRYQLPPDDEVAIGEDGDPALYGSLSQRLSWQLYRLALAGSTQVQCSLPYPDDPSDRSRFLRHLLRVDLPASAFQTALQLNAPRLLNASTRSRYFLDLIPPCGASIWREAAPTLALQFDGLQLRELPAGDRFRLLRACAHELPCMFTNACHLDSAELLELGLSSSILACGNLPAQPDTLARMANWSIPWLISAGQATIAAESEIALLPLAVAAGMRLAVTTGFQANQPGIASPLALLTILGRQTGLRVSQLLHLQIANTAYALGVGHRMGSLETGKEANFLLLDCDDYRELGLHVGTPSIVGTFRRGKLLQSARTPLLS